MVTTYAYFWPERASVLPFYPRGPGQLITNEAQFAGVALGVAQPDLFIRASIGTPVGIFDRMPDPWHVNPNGLLNMQSGRPAPGHALVEWMPYGQDAPPGHVDLRGLEEAILEPGADFTQWYVPWRLVLDLGLSSGLDTSDAFSRRFASLTQVRYTTVPILLLGAGNGLIRHRARRPRSTCRTSRRRPRTWRSRSWRGSRTWISRTPTTTRRSRRFSAGSTAWYTRPAGNLRGGAPAFRSRRT